MKFSAACATLSLFIAPAAGAQTAELPAAPAHAAAAPEPAPAAPEPAPAAPAPKPVPSAPATVTAPPEPQEDRGPGPEAFGGPFFGPGLFALSPLNDRLRANGYQTVPPLMTLIGGEGHTVYRSGFIFGARGAGLLSPTRNGPGQLETRFGGGFGLLDFGYALVRRDPLLLSLYGGLGGYGTSFDINSGQSQSFDAVLQNPQQGSSLGRAGLLLAATLAFDARIPVGSGQHAGQNFVFIGVRVSGLFGPALGSWSLAQANATHGPALGLNGGFAALAIGFGGHPRRRL